MGAVTTAKVAPVRKLMRVTPGTATVGAPACMVGTDAEGANDVGINRVGTASVGGTGVAVGAGLTAAMVPAMMVDIASGGVVGAAANEHAAVASRAAARAA